MDYKFKREKFIFQRDRKENQCYFLTKIKGNYISSYKIQYIANGKGINSFIGLFIPALCGEDDEDNSDKVETVKTLLLKTSIKEAKEHGKKFRELTPSLDWYERDENGDLVFRNKEGKIITSEEYFG